MDKQKTDGPRLHLRSDMKSFAVILGVFMLVTLLQAYFAWSTINDEVFDVSIRLTGYTVECTLQSTGGIIGNCDDGDFHTLPNNGLLHSAVNSCGLPSADKPF